MICAWPSSYRLKPSKPLWLHASKFSTLSCLMWRLCSPIHGLALAGLIMCQSIPHWWECLSLCSVHVHPLMDWCCWSEDCFHTSKKWFLSPFRILNILSPHILGVTTIWSKEKDSKWFGIPVSIRAISFCSSGSIHCNSKEKSGRLSAWTQANTLESSTAVMAPKRSELQDTW